MLSVERLGRREGRLQILQDVSFGWTRGVLAVIGGNGSGKTTLLRVVAGAMKPDAGKVSWDGVATSRAVRRKGKIGYGPQERNLDLAITLREFLSLCADLRGLSGRSAKVAAVAEELGLAKQLDERLANLSGGGRRKAMTAQALLGASELIVLDEPTSRGRLCRQPPLLGRVPRARTILRAGDRDPRRRIGAELGRLDPVAAARIDRAPGAGLRLHDRRTLRRHRRRLGDMGALTLARLIAREASRRPRAILATIMLALSAGFVILPDPGAAYATMRFHGAPWSIRPR